MSNFKEKAEEVVKLLQEYYKNEEGWTVSKKTKDGTTISYKTSEEFPNGYLYKGEAVINAPPSTVFYYVDPLPDGPRAKWDSNMKKIEVLEWLEKPLLRINRACTASACMGLISPRDFVDVITTRETEEGISTNGVSVQYSQCPEDKKYVRGTNHPCGLLCNKIPGEPNKTKLVSLIQPDIGGMLPRALVDSAIPGSMTEFFAELREALKNDGKWIS